MNNEQFHLVNRALADPRRLEILERIANEKEVACAALIGESGVSQPTVSHHLKELCEARLIRPRREAKSVFYKLNRETWRQYLTEMRRRIPLNPNR